MFPPQDLILHCLCLQFFPALLSTNGSTSSNPAFCTSAANSIALHTPEPLLGLQSISATTSYLSSSFHLEDGASSLRINRPSPVVTLFSSINYLVRHILRDPGRSHRAGEVGVSETPGEQAPLDCSQLAVEEWPTPSTPMKLQRFLGFASFYHRVIFDYSRVTAGLSS